MEINRKFHFISDEQIAEDIGTKKALVLKKPERGSKHSAGYDFFAPFGFTLKPGDSLKMPTAIKAEMPNSNFLAILPRSSKGFKYFVRLANTQAVVDADYYNNEKNEGHIWIKIRNEGNKEMHIKAGESFAQGVFQQYFTTSDDNADATREGGIGSTDD